MWHWSSHLAVVLQWMYHSGMPCLITDATAELSIDMSREHLRLQGSNSFLEASVYPDGSLSPI